MGREQVRLRDTVIVRPVAADADATTIEKLDIQTFELYVIVK